MLIQIHMLQNYSPANLNRDDTGSPKDAVFGGVRRGRISSQCLKRSIRRSQIFKDAFESEGLLGSRTRLLPDLIKTELESLDASAEEIAAMLGRISEIGRESAKSADNDGESQESAKDEEAATQAQTSQLIFVSRNELKPLAKCLLEIYRKMGAQAWKKAKMKDITRDLKPVLPRSVDIAMFGRMTTSSAFEDVQAAVQVAHAISTNALAQEFDYFTAVDDLSGESGAGMIGDVEFNSSTYYKYINIHWEQLLKNLGDDVAVARRAIQALILAAAMAHPSGKQNTFAAFNLPDLVLVEVSERNLPVSYANAFLKPARSSGDHTVMEVSIRQLEDYQDKLVQAYALDASRAYMVVGEGSIKSADRQASLPAVLDWLKARLPEEG